MSKYRTQLAYDTGGGPYRTAREGAEAPPDHGAAGRLQLNTQRIKLIRWQIEQLHRELEYCLAEEKQLLDQLRGVRT